MDILVGHFIGDFVDHARRHGDDSVEKLLPDVVSAWRSPWGSHDEAFGDVILDKVTDKVTDKDTRETFSNSIAFPWLLRDRSHPT